MPKPILVITIPQIPTQEYLDQMNRDLRQGTENEYHVIIILGKEVNVEVFYEKDFNQVKFDELKQIIEYKLNDFYNFYYEVKKV
jgi:hypothetical protein